MARLLATALKPGDVIGIIAPASPARSQERIVKSAQYFERLGYRVELGKHVNDYASLPAPSYLAASDKDRLADFHGMLRNKRVKAIFYHRGGFGSIRLLDAVDYALVRANPKIMVGYSDATALFAALHKQVGHASCFFGPMPGVDLWNDVDPFTEENFWRAMTSNTALGSLPFSPKEGSSVSTIKAGAAAVGNFVGGNLTVFCSLLGTPYQPSFHNAIPLLEEIEEKPRKIDAYLAQLRLAGLFEQSKAVLLGHFTRCEKDDAPTRPLIEVFDDYFSKLKIPVLADLPFGHEPRMWTLPLGVKMRVESGRERPTVSVMETVLE